MAELHRAGLHGVEHLQRRHDLARGKGADLEFAVGQLADAARHEIGAAEQRVKALWPARCQPPLDGRLRLRDRGRGDGAGGDTGGRLLEE